MVLYYRKSIVLQQNEYYKKDKYSEAYQVTYKFFDIFFHIQIVWGIGAEGSWSSGAPPGGI